MPAQHAQMPDGGRVAYDDSGSARRPLVVCVPGIGDLRSQYRFVAPALQEAGFRVVTMDLRGLGDSDTSFTGPYNGESVGKDIIQVISEVNAGPAFIIGNSLAAGAAVYAAAEAPRAVAGIVLVGGFTRGPKMSGGERAFLKLLTGGPWYATHARPSPAPSRLSRSARSHAPSRRRRNAVWRSYYDSLYKLDKPADHAEHVRQIMRNLRDPKRSAALAAFMLSSHAHSESRYSKVQAPTLVVMGSKDPDFKPDPRTEADEVAAALRGTVAMIDGAGHYPHMEAPQPFLDVLVPFLTTNKNA